MTKKEIETMCKFEYEAFESLKRAVELYGEESESAKVRREVWGEINILFTQLLIGKSDYSDDEFSKACDMKIDYLLEYRNTRRDREAC